MIISGGYPYSGEAIGILMFDNRRYPMAPGNVGNASSYAYPVRLKVVDGLDWYPPHADEWGDPRPPEVDLLVNAARELEREGVRAIVTCCGFFSTVQDVLAAAVAVPVFTSPLILLPMLQRMISSSRSIGVFTASKPHLDDSFLRAAGVSDMSRIQVFGAEASSEFMATHLGGTRTDLDLSLLEQQLVDIAGAFADANPDLGMLLLECTTFPSFAAAIQQRVGLPVVDYIGFIDFIFKSVVCKRYTGFL
jgi:Asp/Glu/hydantoin racemase